MEKKPLSIYDALPHWNLNLGSRSDQCWRPLYPGVWDQASIVCQVSLCSPEIHSLWKTNKKLEKEYDINMIERSTECKGWGDSGKGLLKQFREYKENTGLSLEPYMERWLQKWECLYAQWSIMFVGSVGTEARLRLAVGTNGSSSSWSIMGQVSYRE